MTMVCLGRRIFVRPSKQLLEYSTMLQQFLEATYFPVATSA